MNAPQMPDGMVEISREEFFAALGAGQHYAEALIKKLHTDWITGCEDDLWGWSIPGWKNSDAPRVYAIFPDTLEKLKATQKESSS